MNLQVPYKPDLLKIRITSFSKRNCNVFLFWWYMMVQGRLYHDDDDDGGVVSLLILIPDTLTCRLSIRKFVFLTESFCGFLYFLQAIRYSPTISFRALSNP
jgi:hypothetical protein